MISDTNNVLALKERRAGPKPSRTDLKESQRATQTQSILRWVGRGGQLEMYWQHVKHVPLYRFFVARALQARAKERRTRGEFRVGCFMRHLRP